MKNSLRKGAGNYWYKQGVLFCLNREVLCIFELHCQRDYASGAIQVGDKMVASSDEDFRPDSLHGQDGPSDQFPAIGQNRTMHAHFGQVRLEGQESLYLIRNALCR
jgi:hypothetical protein